MSNKRKGKRTAHPRAVHSKAAVPTELLIATGVKAQRTGDLKGAERAFRRVLQADPENETAIQMLGAFLVEQGDTDEALELFERVVERLEPPSEETYGFFNNYANALRRAGRFPSAEKYLRKLTEVSPRSWQPWHNLGQTLKDLERWDEAAAALRRAVMLEPDFGPNHGVLGEVLQHLGRLHAAEAAFKRCLDLGWASDNSVYTMLGNNYRLLGQLDLALEAVDKALAITGGHPGTHSNVGVVYTQMGRFDEAVEHFNLALEQEESNNNFQCYLGYALLAAGRFEEAFPHWERGIKDGPRGKERPLDKPMWTPDDPGTRVMVYREQGVGDEIMFASIYPDLTCATDDLVIECDGRLVPLFTRSFPGAEVRAQSTEWGKELMDDFDRVIPAGNLMRWFRRSLAEFPDRDAYLVADPEKVDAWRTRLAEVGDGPYIGFSWRSKVRTAERRLEYTRLDEWGDIFAVPGITWVNLQYDDCERELRNARDEFGVRFDARWDWLDLMNDFDEVAALACALDLVITPFNSVAQLCGGLGVPTIATGNRFSWNMFGTDGLPWYRSVKCELRTLPDDWDHVLEAVVGEVTEVAQCAKSAV